MVLLDIPNMVASGFRGYLAAVSLRKKGGDERSVESSVLSNTFNHGCSFAPTHGFVPMTQLFFA